MNNNNNNNNNFDDDQLPGFRFVPMDDELILCYLKPKVEGREDIPGKGVVVFDHNLYDKEEPWEIWDKYKGLRSHDLRKNKDLFFFTNRKKKSEKGSRISRDVGEGGTWKEENSHDVFLLGTTRKIGKKKTFAYKNKKEKWPEQEGKWLMIEYEIESTEVVQGPNLDMSNVICILRMKRDTDQVVGDQSSSNPNSNGDPNNGQQDFSNANDVPQEPLPLMNNGFPSEGDMGIMQQFDVGGGDDENSLAQVSDSQLCFHSSVLDASTQLPHDSSSYNVQRLEDTGEGNVGMRQSGAAGGEQYWAQLQSVVPYGDEENRNFIVREQNQYDHQGEGTSTQPQLQAPAHVQIQAQFRARIQPQLRSQTNTSYSRVILYNFATNDYVNSRINPS